jgi:hypothetical protein
MITVPLTTQSPFRVNRVILAMGGLLPVFPRKRTSSPLVGMSQKCQFQTHAPQQTATLFDHLVSALLKLQGHVRPSVLAVLSGIRLSAKRLDRERVSC